MTEALTLTASLRPAALDARRGIVRLHAEVLTALGLRPGDPVRLVGRRETAGIAALAEPDAARGLLHADDLTLGNLGARDGSSVTVSALPVEAARRITVAGQPEIMASVSPEMLRLALLGKVITVEDNVSLLPHDMASGARQSLANRVGLAWTTVLLTATGIEPGPTGLVTMDTVVGWRDGHATHSPSAPEPAGPAAEEIELAGLRGQAQQLTELLDLGLHHREVLDSLGTDVSLGVLITGPAGSGKSTLVKAVAHSLHARVDTLWGPELAAMPPNDALTALRRSDGILLVSDVDALSGGLATAFRSLIADRVGRGRAVVCTTSRPEDLEPGLRGPGLLEHEISVPLPDAVGRRELLEVLTRGVALAGDVTLDDIAGRTPGFVAADLSALTREAGVRAALRVRGGAAPNVTQADFDAALEVVRPSSMGQSTLDLGRITLDEVGDMADVKQVLTESVLWPLTYPDTFARLGVDAPRGVLLYGPPGCGKTFLVKAIAGTGKANVLSVKGAELLNKWVGESERGVRELFRRARDAAPTLIFLDEVDALAPQRGQSTDGGTTDRVVAALLTELDGVESLRNVVVIGATNRPDLIDPALLRPGRLERLVYVPPPDATAREAILRASARNVPLADDVDLAALAEELDGFSSADCAALLREAALAAMRESLDAATVTAGHVATARTRVRPSLDPAQVAALAAYAASR
ncbi:ATPase [Longispora fulva]|uniref:Transitional endoplasmic reticulum ATPase n=1 Tax=Longispora fulva TaxID=619741 RepID=A0A8J7GK80_9ACTN|nr:AAA family ATPase [Longispora fulva]MBG6139150.1 transitional endoplasmic reticulum ATPase [Longispora fulva]GIG58642.1 ATPase [Longispora fulva]